MKRTVALLFCLFAVIGCDTGERLNRLEKQNADLKAELDQRRAVQDLDLQAKCSKDARTWFNENWQADKDTITLNFLNHYNVKQNKCFILVEWHYKSHLAAPGGESWTKDIQLNDVYENSKYADFSENHYTYTKPQYSNAQEVITCDVNGEQCKTADEFRALVRPFMSN